MYRLCVRDHFMIAHSFKGEIFGPAQRTHGATYVVDVVFQRPELDQDGLVIDIGLASETVKEVLAGYNYRNLDEVSELSGQNTTTEFMAKVIFDQLAAAIKAGRMGETAKGLTQMEIKLHESHVAWASYEGAL
ncbi:MULTISPECIES: 6-carboxytetrahydropterin synthase [Halomonadaceae]|jgi:6-pyruvoyl-tetrahydropterin synthase|uniref:6-carboxy-5,6,7,8-tetrahydropterin synthase n=1 Tax=Vreelandella piezotolerans TaxID=2609667 RepID=A0ABQ6XD48_9GAMM|nr:MULTISPECIES: 6-carboxytetrahydropterin synthase [Halomonas]KAE8439924.1 6-carboxytetrahydropterin synthase [Halomonas piezotolerans]MCG7576657.1 6-carboxytetrahydropterin synthase [Halomonas sp. MMH1-48]MCG7589408.1 6-carboxytetrahydropterin synthase [Halomonas sp. McD50-5]MCG7603720.1 6-carboxytetrahydropterin synthase [Halomonas sp. MM17-34]MCG7612808.1 6-carboxytetrahydropterin synthase [Halomonas sp. MM17-29]